ncbi:MULTISPECIES: DUF6520 family protein [Flavobacteriaceae]|jgi:hypothetical protein|uniref:DUF6520 family protein n=1 Tax=Flavobacteriaceae TaxID=49546 RepID=UPI00055F02C6|nr:MULTISPECIES: DUF6520 family protein [unclassified Allomuricauda]
MKSNFLKLVLPAFAILLAVGLAFATEDRAVFQDGHYYDTAEQEWRSIPAEGCGETGNTLCKHLGYQLYSMPSFGSTPLRKNVP